MKEFLLSLATVIIAFGIVKLTIGLIMKLRNKTMNK